jgi:flagellar assembly protein FliH
MSSNAENLVPVTMLKYREATGAAFDAGELLPNGSGADAMNPHKDLHMTKAEFAERIARERASAASETEQRFRAEHDGQLAAARASIATAIAEFKLEGDKYYAKVEAEIVQLSLAIAAKILHREAQVDPMLMAALVRIALDNMREGSSVTIRVCPGKGETWREYFAGNTSVSHIDVVEDVKLADLDCLVETELGSANFSIEKQLKEVEQGFFDLLALRPAAR